VDQYRLGREGGVGLCRLGSEEGGSGEGGSRVPADTAANTTREGRAPLMNSFKYHLDLPSSH